VSDRTLSPRAEDRLDVLDALARADVYPLLATVVDCLGEQCPDEVRIFAAECERSASTLRGGAYSEHLWRSKILEDAIDRVRAEYDEVFRAAGEERERVMTSWERP
jgi:hypothetical protein